MIAGTRIRVVDIAIEYEYMNCSPDDIITAHPHLRLEQVHDVLSYYYEHQPEIDKKIKEDQDFIGKLRQAQKADDNSSLQKT